MKKLILLLAAVTVLAACKKNHNDEVIVKTYPQVSFDQATMFESTGTATVIEPYYEKEQVRLVADLITDTTLTLTMYEIKFNERMPVTIDMAVAKVGYVRTGEEIIFAADNVIPTAAGNPYEKYTVIGMSGKITPDSLNLTTKLGEYDCIYKGSFVK